MNSLSGGELAAIERMIIQNAQSKAQIRQKKKKSKPTGMNAGRGPTQSVGVSLSSRQETSKPTIRYKPNGDMTVCHRELVNGVSNSASNSAVFQQVQRLRINPSSKITFKWLSTIAPSFETYRFRKLRFRYIPRCPTSSQGSVLLVPDYDSADANTLTEERATQHVNAVEESVWKECVAILRPESLNRTYKAHFTCTDERFEGTKQDPKTLDAAQFFVFVESNEILTYGKLWVEYEVDLTTPQPPELPFSLGGAGTDKNSGLQAGSANVFVNNTMSALNQEESPILTLLDTTNSTFPGANIFRFNRDWEGFLSKRVEGTTVVGAGPILRNNVDALTTEGFNETMATVTNGIAAVREIYGKWNEGDLLGSGAVSAATLTRMIHNLGGSSVT